MHIGYRICTHTGTTSILYTDMVKLTLIVLIKGVVFVNFLIGEGRHVQWLKFLV